jgi:hypothetical protein
MIGRDKDEVSIITIEELAEDIDMLIWKYGAIFKVTERFPKREESTYFVRGLTVDIEGNIVCCSDIDDIIFGNKYKLRDFLISHVKSIRRVITYNERWGELDFNDGNVLIEVVML